MLAITIENYRPERIKIVSYNTALTLSKHKITKSVLKKEHFMFEIKKLHGTCQNTPIQLTGEDESSSYISGELKALLLVLGC